MATRPKPRPPKRCACNVCKVLSASGRQGLVDAYRTVIALSYTREEFRLITRASKASMLPREGWVE